MTTLLPDSDVSSIGHQSCLWMCFLEVWGGSAGADANGVETDSFVSEHQIRRASKISAAQTTSELSNDAV